jgi:hypothetical protein
MKTVCYILAVIACAVLVPGITLASQPSGQVHGEKQTATDRSIRNHPEQVANNQRNTGGKRVVSPGNRLPAVNNVHRSVVNQPFTVVAKNGLKINKLATPAGVTVRKLPVVIAPVMQLPGGVRNPGAATAAVGQPARSSVKNSAAAISGTGMKLKRKPY